MRGAGACRHANSSGDATNRNANYRSTADVYAATNRDANPIANLYAVTNPFSYHHTRPHANPYTANANAKPDAITAGIILPNAATRHSGNSDYFADPNLEALKRNWEEAKSEQTATYTYHTLPLSPSSGGVIVSTAAQPYSSARPMFGRKATATLRIVH